MVISGVVKSLIINFSPSLIWLPGAGRSVCVSSLSSAGNIHYTCCVTELIFVKWWCWVGLKLTQQLPGTLRPCALLSMEDCYPWCWRVAACGCWKNSSTVPQHPHGGHLTDCKGPCEVISSAGIFYNSQFTDAHVTFLSLQHGLFYGFGMIT